MHDITNNFLIQKLNQYYNKFNSKIKIFIYLIIYLTIVTYTSIIIFVVIDEKRFILGLTIVSIVSITLLVYSTTFLITRFLFLYSYKNKRSNYLKTTKYLIINLLLFIRIQKYLELNQIFKTYKRYYKVSKKISKISNKIIISGDLIEFLYFGIIHNNTSLVININDNVKNIEAIQKILSSYNVKYTINLLSNTKHISINKISKFLTFDKSLMFCQILYEYLICQQLNKFKKLNKLKSKLLLISQNPYYWDWNKLHSDFKAIVGIVNKKNTIESNEIYLVNNELINQYYDLNIEFNVNNEFCTHTQLINKLINN